jgi:hypothetical protein
MYTAEGVRSTNKNIYLEIDYHKKITIKECHPPPIHFKHGDKWKPEIINNLSNN